MGKWRTEYASECGHEVYLLDDWEIPRYCKECKAERDAEWYDVSCEKCGTTIRAHKDWDHAPRFCKSCKQAHDSLFYDRPCQECGKNIRVNKTWEHIPRFCKECRSEHESQFIAKSCEHCGSAMRVKKESEHPTKYCRDCRDKYPPKSAGCEHCGREFTIRTGTQIRCRENNWDLPRKCDECRELFRHKPFRTVREPTVLGNFLTRTYNSRGDLISESRDEDTVLEGNRRVHTSRSGRVVGITRRNERILQRPNRETSRPDGSLKSTAEEETDALGQTSTRSVGGKSKTEHRTRTVKPGLGPEYRETE